MWELLKTFLTGMESTATGEGLEIVKAVKAKMADLEKTELFEPDKEVDELESKITDLEDKINDLESENEDLREELADYRMGVYRIG